MRAAGREALAIRLDLLDFASIEAAVAQPFADQLPGACVVDGTATVDKTARLEGPCFVGAGAHQVGGRTAATEQGECANDDRLAGTRLAREDVETGPELKFEDVDDGQVANAKEADHGPAGTRSSIVSYI